MYIWGSFHRPKSSFFKELHDSLLSEYSPLGLLLSVDLYDLMDQSLLSECFYVGFYLFIDLSGLINQSLLSECLRRHYSHSNLICISPF